MNIAGMNVDLAAAIADPRRELGGFGEEEAAAAVSQSLHHQAAIVNITTKPCAAAGPNTNGNANCVSARY